MKKILVFLVMFGLMFGLVGAVDTTAITTSRSASGFALSQISDVWANGGSNSARLFAALITGPTNEGRVRIDFNEVVTLNDIENISWMQYVTEGYASHLDLFLDIDFDGDADESLNFEYDKVAHPSDQSVGTMNYARDSWINTFDDKGIINNGARAWLNSGSPGCGNNAYDCGGFIDGLLSEWKAGTADDLRINGSTRVLGFEIEVDGWIVESEAYIDDIVINGVVVEAFEESQIIEVDIDEDISLSISPSTLDFGVLKAGTIDNPGQNIIFDATGSNTDVTVEVQGVTGFPFETGLKFNSLVPIGQSETLNCVVVGTACTYSSVEWTTSLTIPAGTVSMNYQGTVVYLVTGPTP